MGDRHPSAAAIPGDRREPPPDSGHADADSATLVADTASTGERARSSARTPDHTRLAGRYEILALVGTGGMGTVYRARDLELDEVVALKVMRPELLETPGILERFRREAKLARRVTHRNVARVFDIGEHEHERFLTMEFVEGESLAAALARDGAFSVPRARAVAMAIADGLDVAHVAGVVHRDLKPDNVILSVDGRVVVTDFGIARAVVDVLPHAGAGSSDTIGGFVGTPAYMAPEQVKGLAEIGPRADVYAFGALLYELLTGQRAWPGDAPLAVATARLIDPPPDPRAVRPDVPAPLAELALRCMAREPGDRPASMREVAAALTARAELDAPAVSRLLSLPPSGVSPPSAPLPRTISSPALPLGQDAAIREKTVAVVPFRNSGPAEDEYVAEELTDDLIDALSMTRGLRVRPRGAVLSYRRTEVDAREIGRALGVQVVVEGSLRKARGQVRIQARLISVADGFQVWAKRFDRPEQEVLSINDEVARSIIEALTLDAHAVAPRVAPSNPIAVDLYLRARHEHRLWGHPHQRRAVELLEQALAIAPDDPLLLSGMAASLARVAFFDGPQAIPRARDAAERAVAAAPHLAEAHLALGSVLFQMNDAVDAMRALRRAVALGPGLAEAHAALGRLLGEVGVIGDAVLNLERATMLAPELADPFMDLARLRALDGEWEEADALFLRVRTVDAFAYWMGRARTLMWTRDAARIARELAELPDDEAMRYPRILRQLAATRQLPDQLFDLEREERTGGPRRQTFVLQMHTEVLGYCGRREEALGVVEHAARLGLLDHPWLMRCPLLDELRDSPRFVAAEATVRARCEAAIDAYRTG